MPEGMVNRLYTEGEATNFGPSVRITRWAGDGAGGITLVYWIRNGAEPDLMGTNRYALPPTRVAFSPSMTDAEAIREAIRVYDELAKVWESSQAYNDPVDHEAITLFSRESWDLVARCARLPLVLSLPEPLADIGG